jgi:hypothetical protein
MDIAGTIPVHFRDLNPHNELRSRIGRAQRILLLDSGDALQAESPWLSKVHEEHAHVGIFAEIPHGLVLAIAIVVGKS